ncbi:MAG TPA: DinB family protein [Terriglobales bacterium]|nr:DinB family protein [Terriglobales bacterium]
MKKISLAAFAILVALSLQSLAQEKIPAPSLRSALLEQLKTTHNQKDWFVDGNTAMAGLTPEQAGWTDGHGNHSVGQLAYHLVFWNERSLQKFKGEPTAKFDGNNEVTFNNFDARQWSDITRRFDAVMTELEKLVETADEKKLQEWAPTVARISTHNAYHIGEIVMVRKEQGSWDASKGVK